MTYYSDRMDELKGPAKKPRPVRFKRPKPAMREIAPTEQGTCVLCDEVAKYNINGFKVCASEQHKYLALSF